MPIIIKEVIVRTTVESKKAPQETFPKEWMEKMKREVVEETGEPEYKNGKNQKGQVKWISDGLKNLKLSGIRTERSIL